MLNKPFFILLYIQVEGFANMVKLLTYGQKTYDVTFPAP